MGDLSGLENMEMQPLLKSAQSEAAQSKEESALLPPSAPNVAVLSVIGMTCASCAAAIESALLQVEGVQAAAVGLLQNKVEVSYDPSRVKVSTSTSVWSMRLTNAKSALSQCRGMQQMHVLE